MQYLLAVVVGIALLQISNLITTIYLHRALAHRSLELRSGTTIAMRFGTWLLTGIRPREWVAVHRQHHHQTDVPGDPHSPHLEGYWQIMLGNLFYYRQAKRDPDCLRRYAKDLPTDRLDRWLLRRGLIGIYLTLGLLMLALGVLPGLVAWATMVIGYVVGSAAVNGAGHWFGRQPNPNSAHNLQSLAFITQGEGLHNNHHHRPSRPRFSMRRGEFDPAWPVIALMAKLRLLSYRPLREAG